MKGRIQQVGWALGLWGILSLIFGMLILAWPGITLKSFLIILGIYFFASGVVLAVGSLIQRDGHWVGGAVMGALSIFAGAYVFANPEISALVALTVIALWAIVLGSLQIVAGFSIGRDGIWMGLGGIVSVLFGFYIFAEPAGGALALVWLVGL